MKERSTSAWAKELRRAEDNLVEARDRFRTLYDLAPIAQLTLDGRGTICEANRSASDLLNVDAKELVGRPLAAFMDQRDADILHRHIQQAFESRSKIGVDLMLGRSGNGEGAHTQKRPVHIESVAGRDELRSECHCVIIDLSDQQEAEERRRTWEARANTVLDTAVDAIVSSDATGRIEAFNKAAERLFGYSEREALGRNVRFLIPEPDRGQHDQYIRRYVDTGEARIMGRPNRDVIGLRKDGSRFPLELSIGEWWDHGQRKFTAIIHDITERKRAEDKLRESEARFRQIAEHVDDVFVLYDRVGRRVVYVNPAFQAISGRPSTDLCEIGTGWVDWVAPDDRQRVAVGYRNMLKGDPFDEEFRILRPDGGIRWVRARNFPIEDEFGSVHRDVAVIQDVTSERALEEELRQAQKMEAIGALASGVAHDFNNVLQAILGCINIARSEGDLPGRADAYLERAANAAERGGDLANQLMAFTRKQHNDPRPVAIDNLLQGLGKLIGRLVTEQITVRMDLGAPEATIFADPIQLERVLMNLAANARDAMPEGGILTIRTEVVLPGTSGQERAGLDPTVPHLRLIVKDSGVGMDYGTQSRIFEPFFTTKDTGKGTGLGLATVFAVLKEFGGHIDVDSELGKGTTFTLYLPCQDQPEEESQDASSEIMEFVGTALLVEDDRLVRMTVRHYLEDLGLEVLEADGIEQARTLCEAQEGPLDLLVSDVVMPVMRGPQLAQFVRANNPSVPVLLMSANPDFLADEERLLDNALILRKPFTRQDLVKSLQTLLGP